MARTSSAEEVEGSLGLLHLVKELVELRQRELCKTGISITVPPWRVSKQAIRGADECVPILTFSLVTPLLSTSLSCRKVLPTRNISEVDDVTA
jgi:hypothetical protein